MELRNLHRRVHIGERGLFDPMVAIPRWLPISSLEDILNHVWEAPVGEGLLKEAR